MSENNKDYRMSFIHSVEQSLASLYPSEEINKIINKVTMVMNDYEIVERCTDLVLLDDANERLIKRYCACLMVDGKSEKTIYQYKRTITRLSDFIHKPFTEMGAYDIRFYLACEKERGVSNGTLENNRASISAFFQWMTLEDVIPKNPMLTVKPIKCTDEIRKPFSDVEIDSLRSACKSLKERAIVELLLSSGVRVSELCDLKLADIDFNTLELHVLHGKDDKERCTYITPVAMNHLKKYLTNRNNGDEYVFINKNHGQLKPGGVRFILNKIAERAKVKNVHPHRFRRTFASGLASRGMPIQEIQILMGHSKMDTTLEYIFTDNERVKTSYKKYIA